MSNIPLIDGPRLRPLSGSPAKNLVILLHGYGADGDDLIGLAQYWQSDFPDTAFVAPNAPEPCELSPFGRQWFSLERYDPDLQRRDPAAGAEVFASMIEGAQKAQRVVDQFIAKETEAHSLSLSETILVGFSQGTMVSLYTGLREQVAPAGILGYSGALVGDSKLNEELNCRPPICLIHGEEDEIVPFPALARATKMLTDLNIDVTAHSCPGLGHGIDERGLKIGQSFVKEVFSNI
ncbi:alpha/beta hydrolase [Sneathiella marina]|uniref:Alpha/beta hydrolase n=1 Tax=Sneathiella marina TaxID=2950108 RepID=A0ABY4W1T2_9PROT|nr:dienelactone hydrolase family protein [Sneathiella marina]USG61038.1 alpha/beta hydrolase [Sneathiella marina]